MGSKKQKQKKKRAAAMARKNVNAANSEKKQSVKERNEISEENKYPAKNEIPAELPEVQYTKAEKATETVPDIKEKKNVFSAIGNWLTSMKKSAGRGWYVSLTIGGVLLVAVIFLLIRVGGLSKELESVQAMSVSLQKELDETKRERDKAELELFSAEKETVYVEVYPTATPEPTPEAEPTQEPVRYVVCVDAGHGDWDGGATIVDDNYRIVRAEKNDNLWMSKLFRDALSEYENVEVVMTREDDTFLELSERTDIANEIEADALISFHRNAFDGNAEVNGVEFWIHSSRPKDAENLANEMLDAIIQVGGMEDRGVKSGSMSSFREDYSINRRASMTSMIIELGFITSEKDNTAYDENGEAYAKEMAKVVYEWLEERRTQE